MITQKINGVVNAKILDPNSGSISAPARIDFDGKRIDSITPHSQTSPASGLDGYYDAGGAIVMPGLVDSHVHITANTAGLSDLGHQSPSYNAATAFRAMEDSLLRGFTTLRDAGGADFGFYQAIQDDLVTAPHLYFAGKSISQTGGHADMRGPGTHTLDEHPCCPHMGVVCDGADEVRKAAREQLRTGAHHLKIMLSGGVASPTDRIDSTQFSDAEIIAAVEEASSANRYVLGHAYTAKSINRGLRLGVRSIEHGNFLDEESVDLFLKNDAFLVPTLITYYRLKEDGLANGLPASSLDKLDEVLEAGLSGLKLASDKGVNIAYGSDLLGDMRDWQNKEFEIRSRVQKPLDLIRSATVNAAKLLMAEGEIGEVAEGGYADLLIMNGNPLDDISLLVNPSTGINSVISKGSYVSRHSHAAGL